MCYLSDLDSPSRSVRLGVNPRLRTTNQQGSVSSLKTKKCDTREACDRNTKVTKPTKKKKIIHSGKVPLGVDPLRGYTSLSFLHHSFTVIITAVTVTYHIITPIPMSQPCDSGQLRQILEMSRIQLCKERIHAPLPPGTHPP
jgi:hypothetical protein